MEPVRTTTPEPTRAEEEDLRAVERAHAVLDELRVPHVPAVGTGRGPQALLARLELLRAGRFDPSRIAPPLPAAGLRRCAGCGLLVLAPEGGACPSCGGSLE